jgi:hypothetical protein
LLTINGDSTSFTGAILILQILGGNEGGRSLNQTGQNTRQPTQTTPHHHNGGRNQLNISDTRGARIMIRADFLKSQNI